MQNENNKSNHRVEFAESINQAIQILVDNIEAQSEQTSPERRTSLYLKGIFKIMVLNTQILAEMAEKQKVKLN